MFAIELSASSFWAREMRGTLSIASTVAFFAASRCSSSGFCAGQRKLIRRRAFAQQVRFVDAELRVPLGRPHLQHDVGRAPERPRVGEDLGAGLAVRLVGEVRGVAGAGLDGDR